MWRLAASRRSGRSQNWSRADAVVSRWSTPWLTRETIFNAQAVRVYRRPPYSFTLALNGWSIPALACCLCSLPLCSASGTRRVALPAGTGWTLAMSKVRPLLITVLFSMLSTGNTSAENLGLKPLPQVCLGSIGLKAPSSCRRSCLCFSCCAFALSFSPLSCINLKFKSLIVFSNGLLLFFSVLVI